MKPAEPLLRIEVINAEGLLLCRTYREVAAPDRRRVRTRVDVETLADSAALLPHLVALVATFRFSGRRK